MIKEVYDKLAALGRSSDETKELKEQYFACLEQLKNGVDSCGATEAVVGFRKDGSLVTWDMEKGDMLAAAATGVAMNYLSCVLPILSMALRFTDKEFRFYHLSSDPCSMKAMFPENCVGESVWGDYNRYETLGKIMDEIKRRIMMSETMLKEQPFLLIAMGNPCCYGADSLVKDIFTLVASRARNIRCAFMCMTTRIVYDKALFCRRAEEFGLRLLGPNHADDMADIMSDFDTTLLETKEYANFRDRREFIVLGSGKTELINSPYISFASVVTGTELYKAEYEKKVSSQPLWE